MCPVCLATAALIAGSATGSGGITALVAGTILKRRSHIRFPGQTKCKGGQRWRRQRSSDQQKVVSHDEWVTARKPFLAKEKEFTRRRDELSRQRRELPWERVEKPYEFQGPQGQIDTGRSL